ncbi:MAG: SDR family oxidoreductase [candidate division Zixibacteria bacterium]|nr:SDR family oxidoreductase [candidate division Zixibacteria bacterium]
MQRYLITGASRGIGRAIALKLAAPDRKLFLVGRDQEALVEVFTEVEAAGATPEILVCDLTSPQALEDMVSTLGDEPLDLLVNNAGTATVKPYDDVTLEEWQDALALNVTAPFLLTQKLAPRMPAGASIVNILSVAAKTGFPGWSSYCACKFALEGFSQSIRAELRDKGVRVINVYPAATATDIWDEIDGDWPRDKMMAPEETAEAVAYALSRPASVLVEDITVGGLGGNL